MQRLPRGYHNRLAQPHYAAVLMPLLTGPKAYFIIYDKSGLSGQKLKEIMKDLCDKRIVKTEEIIENGRTWTRYLIEPSYKPILEKFYSER